MNVHSGGWAAYVQQHVLCTPTAVYECALYGGWAVYVQLHVLSTLTAVYEYHCDFTLDECALLRFGGLCTDTCTDYTYRSL